MSSAHRAGDVLAVAFGACALCPTLFAFNPDTVPSIENEPICHDCIRKINKKARELGQQTVYVPEDAYPATW